MDPQPTSERSASDLSAALADAARRAPGGPALRVKRRGLYWTYTWSELDARASLVAAGLDAIGFLPGSLLLTVSDVGPDWLVATLAAHRLGGTVLPVSASGGDAALATAIAVTRPRFVLAHGPDEVARVVAHLRELPKAVRILHVDPRASATVVELASLAWLEALGRRARARERHDEDPGLAPAFVTFTSEGEHTRRDAHSHGALLAEALSPSYAFSPDDEVWLAPQLGFTRELLAALASWLRAGARLCIGEAETTAEVDLPELRPTRIVAPATWFEALWRDSERRLPAAGTLSRTVVDWAFREGAGPAKRLLEPLVLASLRKQLGLDRVRAGLVTNGPLHEAATRWFLALAVHLGSDVPHEAERPEVSHLPLRVATLSEGE